MESQAVRRWADKKVDAIAVRVVLDEVDESCPSEVPADETLKSQISFALTHLPQMPLLLKTGWRSSRGMKTLSTFLKSYLEAI